MNNYTFLDSLSFLDGSLASVSEDLHRSGHSFDLIDKCGLSKCGQTGNYDPEAKRLLLRKGVFPYEFVESKVQMEKTTKLPPKEAFYSRLTGSHISDEDYKHAQDVFDFFQCDNLLQYCQLYCCLDVVLLAESVLAFRKEVLTEFGLDTFHFISLPQLAYQCMLLLTGANLQYLYDVDMALMLESGIRGGTCFIANRYAKAGPSRRNAKVGPSRMIVPMDANNLCE
jgi:hypothetical protein